MLCPHFANLCNAMAVLFASVLFRIIARHCSSLYVPRIAAHILSSALPVSYSAPWLLFSDFCDMLRIYAGSHHVRQLLLWLWRSLFAVVLSHTSTSIYPTRRCDPRRTCSMIRKCLRHASGSSVSSPLSAWM